MATRCRKGGKEILALLNPPSHKRISTLALIPPLKRLGSPRSEVGGQSQNENIEYWKEKGTTGGLSPAFQTEESPSLSQKWKKS